MLVRVKCEARYVFRGRRRGKCGLDNSIKGWDFWDTFFPNFYSIIHGITMAQQARYWLLTINDSDNGDSWVPPTQLGEGIWSGIGWLRGQKESGSNTGREHWQLFVSFKRAVRLAAVRKCFGTRVHAEPSRSEAAEDYVFKDDTAIAGTRFELGSKPFKRNSKTDWESAKQCAKEGRLDDCPPDVYIKYYRTLKAIAMDNMNKPTDKTAPTGIWIFGAPGVGKSFYARQHYGSSLYLKAQNKWWDGYQGEKNVLLDDFDCKALGHYIKIWADAYAFMAECKGSSIQIRPDNFIITSNYMPEDIFDDPVLAAAVRRRFYFITLNNR